MSEYILCVIVRFIFNIFLFPTCSDYSTEIEIGKFRTSLKRISIVELSVNKVYHVCMYTCKNQ